MYKRQDGTGLAAFAREFPERTYDVGIAEECAVTLASGMALRGALPVSYTHLDVYKRQALKTAPCAGLVFSLCPSCGFSELSRCDGSANEPFGGLVGSFEMCIRDRSRDAGLG